MSWNLSFISEQEFTDHVRATIQKYGDKLESFDLKRFNRNIVDPVKLIFDKTVYRATWEETISNEIFRQRDKSNNNDIGYFHQRIFNMWRIAMYHRMVKKAAGMSFTRTLMELHYQTVRLFTPSMLR